MWFGGCEPAAFARRGLGCQQLAPVRLTRAVCSLALWETSLELAFPAPLSAVNRPSNTVLSTLGCLKSHDLEHGKINAQATSLKF